MRREVIVVFAVGFILVGEVALEKQRPYRLVPDHNHSEIPAGNINFSNRVLVDSSAATSTAATSVLNLPPALMIVK